ncbi:hypothetical protein DM02DRAFT_579354 [Periconia macrospinosa]|uniref:Telomere length regulation protein conserved domain-containing protein n=1 Tax=Periconia macrospinosa TaxID=97972 RepID=A0A2V1EFD3_9PLEO|nr:hypothetical protein DM02DRAFT_579354 [Periconia macrospinosa]
MDDFLTPISTTKVKREQSSQPLTSDDHGSTPKATEIVIDSPESVLKALKEQPDPGTVREALKYLAKETDEKDGYSLVKPGPVSANIAYQLINTTVPDYWQTIREIKSQANHLIRCLSNPCGIGAIIARLRPLIADCRQKKPVGQTRDPSSHIQDLLEILERIFQNAQLFPMVWSDICTHAKDSIQGIMMWKEFVGQVASGRVLALAAEAEDVLKNKVPSRKATWLSDGNEYGVWLGRNISKLMRTTEKNDNSATAVVEICTKAFSLGYTDRVVSSMLLDILNSDSAETLAYYINQMKVFEQRKYLNAIITFLAKQYFNLAVESKEDAPIASASTVSGAATLVTTFVKDNEPLKEGLVSLLTKSGIPALNDSLLARRAVIAAVAQDEDHLHTLLENGLKLFGDSFYIKHAPILQQESLAQTIAITCGYVQRSQPMFLTMMGKSSYHISGTSNRIGASSPRARFLGMAVAMAISRMVETPELQLKFDFEGPEAAEAKWYQHLTAVNDKLGDINALKKQSEGASTINLNMRPKIQKPKETAPKTAKTPAITEIQGPRIVEIFDDSTDEDEDLVPYEKPDSDPEDETDDPTEINRNKPSAPVYIRDLIVGLRDQENYERHQLALSTAAALIRRKTNFGTEVTDHIEELATVLVGLNDNLELEKFAEQRQQALIAVLLAKPAEMAQWFSRTLFSGDYSLTQRTAMLTTLGLGARELAGLKDTATEDLIPPSPSFPSKQLPSHLHKLYAPESADPLNKITSGVTKSLLSPLAAQAADSLTGPNILKVRTFSSRMEVEKKRSKPIPNALAQIVADNFFFPLTGRWWLQARSDKSGSSSIYTSTHLLPPFLQTLALLIQASGPSTLSLPQMTREMWDLLLSVRGLALNDKRILSALLFAFLMLLETNEDKERIATDHGRELMETLEWTKMVFDGLPAGAEGGAEERVRVLAAGVVVRAQEVVEKYQRRLVGNMMDY